MGGDYAWFCESRISSKSLLLPDQTEDLLNVSHVLQNKERIALSNHHTVEKTLEDGLAMRLYNNRQF